MSHEANKNSKIFQPNKLIAGFAATIALGGAIKYGPGVLDDVGNAVYKKTTDPSLIVAGTPGQIENYYTKRVWTGKTLARKYWLGIEQCPSDANAAKKGSPTASYNQDVGAMNPQCNYDLVRVNPATYNSVRLGDEITLSGNAGEALRK